MGILSKAERDAKFIKDAAEATKKANATSKSVKQPSSAMEKIKEQLQKLGYKVTDDDALGQIIGDSKTLKHDQIAILSEKGIITFDEKEFEAEQPAPTSHIPFEADQTNPTWEESYIDPFASGQPHLIQNEELKPAPRPKVFSVSEFLAEETPAQRTITPKVTKPENVTTFRVNEDDNGDSSQPHPAKQTSEDKQKITSPKANNKPIEASAESSAPVIEEDTPSPASNTPKQKQTSTNDSKPALANDRTNPASSLKDDTAWQKDYTASLTKWCQTSVDKRTNQPKRDIAEKLSYRDEQDNSNHVSVTIKPLSPIAKKRGDHGVIYDFQKKPEADKVEVTVKNLAENSQPLNYDYFYALVKAARDSGADTIEFNNIRTPEFRDKLLAAALQFKMKLKNPPGAINLQAEHLQSIPPGCRQYLEKHNEAVKKAMLKMGKEIIPEKGSKYGEGPRAEERTHAEKVYIESLREEEKLRRAERHRRKEEKRLSSPSTADYDRNPERGNRDPAKRPHNNNRHPYNNNRQQRPVVTR